MLKGKAMRSIDRVLDRLSHMRYFRWFGSLMAGAATFGIGQTILDSIGVRGSVSTFLALSAASALVAALSYVVMLSRRIRQLEVTLARSSYSTRSVATSRIPAIGVLAPLSSWPTQFYANIVRAIREAADRELPEHQRRVVVFDIPQDSYESVCDVLSREVVEEHVQGIIAVNIKLPKEMQSNLVASHDPVVNMFHIESHPPFVGNIVPDHCGFQELVDHVLDYHRARSAVLITKALTNPLKDVRVDPDRKEKRDIFVSAARRLGFGVKQGHLEMDETAVAGELCATIVEIDQYTAETGALIFDRLLAHAPENTAVVCLADLVSVGIILAAKRTGKNCRERGLRITGFDNTSFAEWFGVSTVDQRLNVMGRLAYDRLQAVLDAKAFLRPLTESVATVFIKRQSCCW